MSTGQTALYKQSFWGIKDNTISYTALSFHIYILTIYNPLQCCYNLSFTAGFALPLSPCCTPLSTHCPEPNHLWPAHPPSSSRCPPIMTNSCHSSHQCLLEEDGSVNTPVIPSQDFTRAHRIDWIVVPLNNTKIICLLLTSVALKYLNSFTSSISTHPNMILVSFTLCTLTQSVIPPFFNIWAIIPSTPAALPFFKIWIAFITFDSLLFMQPLCFQAHYPCGGTLGPQIVAWCCNASDFSLWSNQFSLGLFLFLALFPLVSSVFSS